MVSGSWSLAAVIILGWSLFPSILFSAQSNAAIGAAKNEAEASGFTFDTSHDEIVTKARKEGQLSVLSSLESLKEMRQAFVQKYPFINVRVQEATGTDTHQRIARELKAGTVKDWDVINASSDFYGEFTPFIKKFDILGMAKNGILGIPVGMIDPNNRKVVGVTSQFAVVAYNKTLISAEKVPNKWDDFLNPEFKKRKFVVDLRPHPYTAMVPLLGLDWVLQYCRKLAAQDPVWFRGQARVLPSIANGEYMLHAGINYHFTLSAMKKDPTGNLQFKIVEPVPLSLVDTEGVLINAPHPYAALLWLEFEASAQGQEIIDKVVPLKSSLYSPDSAVAKALRGKKTSVLNWDNFSMKEKWAGQVIEAFGFPKASQ
jgi:ABC-type Fe3+ transport system substrate-binding protein